MNKKIFMITLMLLAMLTVAIMPVQAAPKTKQNFELVYTSPAPIDYGDASHASPVWSLGPDNPDQKVFHAREIVHQISSATITIGDDENYQLWSGWSITGDWEFLCAGIYTHQYTITQTVGNTFTGFGTYPSVADPTTYEVVYGTIDPMTGDVIMIGVYYSDPARTVPTGYTFTAVLTIAPDGSMTGALTSGHSFVSTSGKAIYIENDFAMEAIGAFNYIWNTGTGTFRTEQTLVFDEGTIELLVLEKCDAMYNFEGTFVGHGTGGLKGVKITGTTVGGIVGMTQVLDAENNPVMTFVLGFTVTGTIMGWD